MYPAEYQMCMALQLYVFCQKLKINKFKYIWLGVEAEGGGGRVPLPKFYSSSRTS